MGVGMSRDEYAKGMSEFKETDYDSAQGLTEFEYELFRNFLGKKVLEVGAGWGRLTEIVQKKHQPTEFLAIEPSPDFFAKLQRRVTSTPNVTLQNCEVGDLLPTFSGHFDSVFSVHVMEHVENDRKFVEDSIALLNANGRLIVLVPALQMLYSNLDRNIGHFRRYDKKMIKKLLSGLDVKIEKLFYSNFFGVFASLCFLKFGKLEYQSEQKRGKFVFLFKIYNRFFIPTVSFLERFIPVPVGLNLTVVARKLPTD
jgi:phospholipid N-methyltransferase